MIRTVFLNPVEPAKLSVRTPLGVEMDLTVAFLSPLGAIIDPGELLAQLVLMPRSSYKRYAYDFETVDASAGTASVTVPGPALADQLGYNVEIYQRINAPNPDDPPVPAGLIATGVLATQGLAYQKNGPLFPMTVPQIVGPVGPMGPAGPANQLSVLGVETGLPGSDAEVIITGISPAQQISFVIPQGDTGDPGPANVLSIGTVDTGAPGSSADATITGTSPNQTLNLTIPRGDVGAPSSLTVGTVTTLPPGSPATATITGTAPNQTIDFGIPQGIVGPTGATGAPAVNLRSGTVDPSTGTGVDGDFYVNTATGSLFGPKAGASWPVIELTTYWA